MSTESKKFWQDQVNKKGAIIVPDLLDDWAAKQCAAKDAEIAAHKAEIERLTNGITEIDMLIMFSSQDSGATALIEAIHDRLKALLSPADGDGKETEKPMRMTPQACNVCSGSGWEVQFMTSCTTCNGTGTIIPQP